MSKPVEDIAREIAEWPTMEQRRAAGNERREQERIEAEQLRAEHEAERQAIRDETAAIVENGYGYKPQPVPRTTPTQEQPGRVVSDTGIGARIFAALFIIGIIACAITFAHWFLDF